MDSTQIQTVTIFFLKQTIRIKGTYGKKQKDYTIKNFQKQNNNQYQ